MPNIRVINSNVADQATVAATSSASAALGPANLQTDDTGAVWRSSGTTETLTATWAAAQTFGAVVLPYANLSSLATVQVKVYANTGDAAPAYDSGAVLACPPTPLNLLSWGFDKLGVNAYSYVGAAIARVYIPQIAAQKVAITIVDAGNPAGYLEVGRLIIGQYWEGKKNVDYGATLTHVDTTNNVRSDAGQLLSDVGTTHRQLSFNMSNLTPDERQALWNILVGAGRVKPLFVSVFPENTDPSLEQAHQMYCKRMNNFAMSNPMFQQYISQLEFEEV